VFCVLLSDAIVDRVGPSRIKIDELIESFCVFCLDYTNWLVAIVFTGGYAIMMLTTFEGATWHKGAHIGTFASDRCAANARSGACTRVCPLALSLHCCCTGRSFCTVHMHMHGTD
jgi:hypothetical protein